MANDSWQTLRVGLPDSVSVAIEPTTSVVGVLLQLLDLAQNVLGVIRALFQGALDPVAALVEQLIQEIEQFLSDVRQVGVYVAGDFSPSWPFDDLRGGYAAYERRMLSRLVDRSDPTRPAFSPGSKVVAVFLYQSFDASQPQQVLTFIDRVRGFFGLPGASASYPPPVNLTVAYGSAGSLPGSFRSAAQVLSRGDVPSTARLRWELPVPPGAGPWPLPAPTAYLVEVSTLKSGFTVAYRNPPLSGSPDPVFGVVTGPSGDPFKLYGGASVIDFGDVAWVDQGGGVFSPPPGPGAPEVVLYRNQSDPAPVPAGALIVGGRYLFQRAFYVTANAGAGPLVTPGQKLVLDLLAEDMPYDADVKYQPDGSVLVTPAAQPATEVYARVSSLVPNVGAGSSPYASQFYWRLSSSAVLSGNMGPVRLVPSDGFVASSKSAPSDALEITFPSADAGDVVRAVTAALVVMVLSRSDLVAQGDVASFQLDCAARATGLEAQAQYLFPMVAGQDPDRLFRRIGSGPATFRGKLLSACLKVAERVLETTGTLSPATRSLVLSRAEVHLPGGAVRPLHEVTWYDLIGPGGASSTIVDSLDLSGDGADPGVGVAQNPLATGADPDLLSMMIGDTSHALPRRPGFAVPPSLVSPSDLLGERAPMGSGSSDYSPVYLGSDGSLRFCRNILLGNSDVLRAAGDVLSIAGSGLFPPRPRGDGAWQAYRLFPQGLPNVDAALGEVQNFLSSVLASTRSGGDAVDAYVASLEQRVLALESLLRRIDGMIALSANAGIPVVSGLLVIADGTDGVVSALVEADAKPSDGPSTTRITETGAVELSGTYGAGVVLLAGGLPDAALDLFLSFFPQES